MAASKTARFIIDILGRIVTVTDAAGVRTMTYDEDTLLLFFEAIAGTGGLINRTITRSYRTDGSLLGRPAGLNVGMNEYVTTWGYDVTGRLSQVTGPALPDSGVRYAYEADSDLVAVTSFLSDASTTLGMALRGLEDHRDVVTEVAN